MGGFGQDKSKDFSNYIFSDIVSSLRDKISCCHFPPPAYDLISHKIRFAGVDIAIPYNCDQDSLCRTLLKDEAAMSREWSWDEILEGWGETSFGKESWRRIYNAGREINQKVASETTVKDLLLVRKFSIAVNPRFMQRRTVG